MSDGKTHHKQWRKGWLVALPLSCLMYGAVDPLPLSWSCSVIGCFSGNLMCSVGVLLGYEMGRYISPDADQIGATHGEGLMVNEIPILGVFLYGHWATYGAIFRKHHRSFWTHYPGASTLIRLFWQFYPLFILMWLKDWNYAFIFQIFWGMLIGLSWADFLHFHEDKLSLSSW